MYNHDHIYYYYSYNTNRQEAISSMTVSVENDYINKEKKTLPQLTTTLFSLFPHMVYYFPIQTYTHLILTHHTLYHQPSISYLHVLFSTLNSNQSITQFKFG